MKPWRKNRLMCIFPSGRMIDMSQYGEKTVRDFAGEFPTINYFYTNLEN